MMVEWQVGMTLKEIEKKVILKAMEYTSNNKTKVAAMLEVSLRTIDNKIKLYRVEDGEETIDD